LGLYLPKKQSNAWEELVKAISGADVTPESPSFSDRCYFCQSHPWACTTTQLALCKQWEQDKRAANMFRGTFSRTAFNTYAFGAVSNGTIAYCMRPLTRAIQTPELVRNQDV